MKKKLSILLSAIAIIILSAAAWLYGYQSRKSSDNLPSLAAISRMDETEVNGIVRGYRRRQLPDVWGDPAQSSSTEDIWDIGGGMTLTVTYDNNNEKAVTCRLYGQ